MTCGQLGWARVFGKARRRAPTRAGRNFHPWTDSLGAGVASRRTSHAAIGWAGTSTLWPTAEQSVEAHAQRQSFISDSPWRQQTSGADQRPRGLRSITLATRHPNVAAAHHSFAALVWRLFASTRSFSLCPRPTRRTLQSETAGHGKSQVHARCSRHDSPSCWHLHLPQRRPRR